MRIGPIGRLAALALFLPLLGGCFVTSENPVLRPGEDGRDPELRGLWVSEEGREFLHVLRLELEEGKTEKDEAPGYSGLYLVSEGDGPDHRGNWARVRMISTTVKDRKILSMRFFEGETDNDLDDIPGWLIFSYEIRDGRLFLHMMEEDPIDAAIKSGRLAGRPKSGTASDPHVTASSGEWVAFLEEEGLSSLFDDDDTSALARLPASSIREIIKGPEAKQTETAQ